ncbi:MAG: type II toxin-antitoxin system PemK/MazF family toxin [Blastocatellia bacterium]|nr:type II toxin-antitoxin system PemK/MazF family toxin [Blastocatellia bacterium]
MALASAGDIVLFRLPQTDQTVGKLRPALLVTALPTKYDDWLVCMVSSQIHQAIPNVDILIDTFDTDFASSGLKSTSIFRTTRLAIAAEHIFVGKLGTISQSRVEDARSRIASWITGK